MRNLLLPVWEFILCRISTFHFTGKANKWLAYPCSEWSICFRLPKSNVFVWLEVDITCLTIYFVRFWGMFRQNRFLLFWILLRFFIILTTWLKLFHKTLFPNNKFLMEINLTYIEHDTSWSRRIPIKINVDRYTW